MKKPSFGECVNEAAAMAARFKGIAGKEDAPPKEKAAAARLAATYDVIAVMLCKGKDCVASIPSTENTMTKALGRVIDLDAYGFDFDPEELG